MLLHVQGIVRIDELVISKLEKTSLESKLRLNLDHLKAQLHGGTQSHMENMREALRLRLSRMETIWARMDGVSSDVSGFSERSDNSLYSNEQRTKDDLRVESSIEELLDETQTPLSTETVSTDIVLVGYDLRPEDCSTGQYSQRCQRLPAYHGLKCQRLPVYEAFHRIRACKE